MDLKVFMMILIFILCVSVLTAVAIFNRMQIRASNSASFAPNVRRVARAVDRAVQATPGNGTLVPPPPPYAVDNSRSTN